MAELNEQLHVEGVDEEEEQEQQVFRASLTHATM